MVSNAHASPVPAPAPPPDDAGAHPPRRCRVCRQQQAYTAFPFHGNTGRRRNTCGPCLEALRAKRRARQAGTHGVPVPVRAPAVHPNRYQALLRAQDGTCAICRQPERLREPDGSARALMVYAYRTNAGTVAALLCYRCNLGMDGFASSALLLSRALGLLLAGTTDGRADRAAVHIEDGGAADEHDG